MPSSSELAFTWTKPLDSVPSSSSNLILDVAVGQKYTGPKLLTWREDLGGAVSESDYVEFQVERL